MSEKLVVVWRVTTRCNLACSFCAYDRTLLRPRPEADPELVARSASALAQWSERSGRPVLVSWIGGEPLLWPHLRKVTEHVHECGLFVSTTTNGTPLVNPDLVRHLCERYAELTVSVDGFAETHNALRGHAGLFDDVRRNVRALAAEILASGSSLTLRANIVLMRRTIPDFPDLCRELVSWGVREISCNQLGGADRPEFFPENRILAGQVERLDAEWPTLQRELGNAGVRLLGGSAYLRRMAASSVGEPLSVADCGPGRRFVFIDETGRVSPCSFTSREYGVSLAELDTAEAWEGLPTIFDTSRNCQRAASCDDCQSTQVFKKFA